MEAWPSNWFGLLLAWAAAAPTAFAADIHVPADQPTIQQGIDAAVDGDRVLVAPGVYRENIVAGRNIQIIGTGGASMTTIDGRGRGHVVTLGGSPGSSIVLSGFTIAGGKVGGYPGGAEQSCLAGRSARAPAPRPR